MLFQFAFASVAKASKFEPRYKRFLHASLSDVRFLIFRHLSLLENRPLSSALLCFSGPDIK